MNSNPAPRLSEDYYRQDHEIEVDRISREERWRFRDWESVAAKPEPKKAEEI